MNIRLTSFILRAGLAVVFAYAGVASLITPENWIGFIPAWLKAIISPTLFLTTFSIYEMLLSLWLLSNKQPYRAAALSALTLAAIIVFNLNVSVLDIVFRDVAILAMALGLMALTKSEARSTKFETNSKS